MTHLIVDNIRVNDQHGRALFENLSFELTPGAVHTVIGESGSGKSIICAAIMGNLPDTFTLSGRIVLNGRDLTKLSKRERRALWGRDVFLLPQEPWLALAQTRSVLAQVGDMPRLHGFAGDHAPQARRLLARVGLSHDQHGWKRPGQLSGGMCQRAAVATALGAPASLILVDEPTKGLDALARDDVVKNLEMLRDSGRTLFLITHDLHVAERIGGTMSVIGERSVVEQGRAREILARPRHALTRALIAARPERWPPTPRQRGQAVAELDKVAIRAGKSGPMLVNDLSLRLYAGEMVGLIGGSGTGKTSVGDALLKLRSPARGDVRWLSTGERRKFQKVYQDPLATFAPWRTTASTLSDALSGSGTPRSEFARIAAPLLKKIGLPAELLARRPDEVSGGELQRLSLVRALLCQPVCLFADELTSRLDALTQKSVIDLLTETMAERAMSVLLVSHDIALINATADRVINIGRTRVSSP